MRGLSVGQIKCLLHPGDLVFLDYAPHGTNTLCRVIDREDKSAEEVQLVLEREPAFTGNRVEEPEDSREMPEPPAVADLVRPRLWEVPVPIAGAAARAVSILTGRGDSYTSYAEIYWSQTGAFAGEDVRLDDLEHFAVPVNITTRASNYSWIQFTFTDRDALPWTSRDYSAGEVQSDTLLLVVDGGAYSLGVLTSSSGSGPWTRRYVATPAAASPEVTFTAPKAAHLILRERLPLYTHPDWQYATSTGWFRIVPRSLMASGTPVSIQLGPLAGVRPVGFVRASNADSGGSPLGATGLFHRTNAAMVAAGESGNIMIYGKRRANLWWPSAAGPKWAPDGYVITVWYALSHDGPEDSWLNFTVFDAGGPSVHTHFDFPAPGWYWMIVQTLSGGRLSDPLGSPQAWIYTDTGITTQIESLIAAHSLVLEDFADRLTALES